MVTTVSAKLPWHIQVHISYKTFTYIERVVFDVFIEKKMQSTNGLRYQL